MPKLIFTLTVLCSILFIPYMPDIRYANAVFLLLIIPIILVVYLWKRINQWILLLLAWCAINTAINVSVYSLEALYVVLSFVLLYWLIKESRIKTEWVLNAVCIGALFQGVYCIFQYFGYDKIFTIYPWNPIEEFTVIGWFGNRNLLGAFIALSFPAFLRNKSIVSLKFCKFPLWVSWLKWWMLLPIILWPLLLTSTKGGLFAIVIAGIITAFWHLRKHRQRILVYGLILFSVLVLIKGFPIGRRMPGYKKIFYIAHHMKVVSIQQEKYIITTKPHIPRAILGHGLGLFRIQWPLIRIKYWPKDPPKAIYVQAHCEPLQVLYELGYIGLLIVIGFIGTTIVKPMGFRARMAFMIIVLNSLTHFPFHVGSSSFLAVVWFVIVERGEVRLWSKQYKHLIF